MLAGMKLTPDNWTPDTVIGLRITDEVYEELRGEYGFPSLAECSVDVAYMLRQQLTNEVLDKIRRDDDVISFFNI
jgi:hypothetical protein